MSTVLTTVNRENRLERAAGSSKNPAFFAAHAIGSKASGQDTRGAVVPRRAAQQAPVGVEGPTPSTRRIQVGGGPCLLQGLVVPLAVV